MDASFQNDKPAGSVESLVKISAEQPPLAVSNKFYNSPKMWAILIGGLLLSGMLWIGLAVKTKELEKPPPSPTEEMLSRADNYYHQIRQTDNEMAISLYEQVIAMKPDSASAQAGLANALVQKRLRWSSQDNLNPYRSLGEALSQGRFDSVEAQQSMGRALALAERAVRVEPDNVKARKALGFVLTTLSRFNEAMHQYQRALELDPGAWQVLINAGEIQDILGDKAAALQYYKRAFDAMTSRFKQHIVQIRPWYADLGALVAERYSQHGAFEEAEVMYRRVLAFAPLHIDSVLGLARILIRAGDSPAAITLCKSLNAKTHADYNCSESGILESRKPTR